MPRPSERLLPISFTLYFHAALMSLRKFDESGYFSQLVILLQGQTQRRRRLGRGATAAALPVAGIQVAEALPVGL